MDAVCELPLGVSWPATASEDLSALPRNERVQRTATALRVMIEERGAMLPVPLVRQLLGVSRQRIHQIFEQGHLECVDLHGHHFVPEDSLLHYVNTERKLGRPVKVPKSTRELMKASMEAAKEIAEK